MRRANRKDLAKLKGPPRVLITTCPHFDGGGSPLYAPGAAAFEAGVVLDTDSGEHNDFLAAQADDAPL